MIFSLYRWFRVGFATIFVVGIFLVSGRAIVIGMLALIEKTAAGSCGDAVDPPPDVTVLIPAHNEEKGVIVQTPVTSVLATNTPNLQIIVVDDGSTDQTGALLDEHFSGDARVHIIHQVNRGNRRR